jgi:hypothetical protein
MSGNLSRPAPVSCTRRRFNTTNAGTYSFTCLVTNSCGSSLAPAAQVFVLPATTGAPPPVINFTDGACVLTWTGDGLLEATNVSGPWTTNTHTPPFTFSPRGAAKFYRTYIPN